MEDEFRPVPGYEGLYEINREGVLKNVKTGEMKEPQPDKDGYLRTVLYKDNEPEHKFIHRLVAEVFDENYSEDLEVNHKGGDRQAINADDLEMMDRQENLADRDERQRFKKILEKLDRGE